MFESENGRFACGFAHEGHVREFRGDAIDISIAVWCNSRAWEFHCPDGDGGLMPWLTAQPASGLIWNIDQRNVMQMKPFELEIYCHDLIVIKCRRDANGPDHSSIESIYLTVRWHLFFDVFAVWFIAISIAVRSASEHFIENIRRLCASYAEMTACSQTPFGCNRSGSIGPSPDAAIVPASPHSRGASSHRHHLIVTISRAIFVPFYRDAIDTDIWFGCCAQTRRTDALSPEHRTDSVVIFVCVCVFVFLLKIPFAAADRHFLRGLHSFSMCHHLSLFALVCAPKCNLISIVNAKHGFFDCSFHLCAVTGCSLTSPSVRLKNVYMRTEIEFKMHRSHWLVVALRECTKPEENSSGETSTDAQLKCSRIGCVATFESERQRHVLYSRQIEWR